MKSVAIVALLLLCVCSVCSAKMLDLKLEDLQALTKKAAKDEVFLVEFYAPWCHHCTDLFPVLEELSMEMEAEYGDKVKVGKLNAVVDKMALEEAGLEAKGFPTIRLWYDAAWHRYSGSRSKEHMTDTIRRMRAPTVDVFASFEALQARARDDEGQDNFVFVFQPGKDKKNAAVSKETLHLFEQVATEFKLVASFASLKQGGPGPHPRIMKVVHAGGGRELRVQLAHTFDEAPDQEFVKKWVAEHNHGVMTTFDNSNFKRLGSLGKFVVAAVLDGPEESHFALDFEAEVMSRSDAHHTKAVYGILDGSRWKQFTKRYNVPVPSLLIMDLAGETQHVSPMPLSREDISAVLDSATDGSLDMNATGGSGYWARIVFQWNKYYPFSILFLVPVFLLIVAFFNPVPRKDHLD